MRTGKGKKVLDVNDPHFIFLDGNKVQCIICHSKKVMATSKANEHAATGKHRDAIARWKERCEIAADLAHSNLEGSSTGQDQESIVSVDHTSFAPQEASPMSEVSDGGESPDGFAMELDYFGDASELRISSDIYADSLDNSQSGGHGWSDGIRLADEPPIDDDSDEEAMPIMPETAEHEEATSTNTIPSPDSPFFPYPSRPMLLTSLLFGSPNLRFSEPQKRSILHWGRSMGAENVPTLYAIRKHQERLFKEIGNPTHRVPTHGGNVFYLNSISKAIAKDYANPRTRALMIDYPEEGLGYMSQAHNGSKMLNLPPDLGSPTVRVDGKIYFTGELLQHRTGQYFIPTRFFFRRIQSEKALFALGHAVSHTEVGFSVDPAESTVATDSFQRNYDDILRNEPELSCGFTLSSQSFASKMPHPLHAKSEGRRMVYSTPLILFMDDVSGNISKQWNKHHAVYMSNATLPREALEKRVNIHFVASSPHATPMELMKGVRDSIVEAAAGVITWDSLNEEEMIFLPYELFQAADNPMQAEECSHAGVGCNHFCRTCNIGGKKTYTESLEGFQSLFTAGEMRTAEKTTEQIRHQVKLAQLSGGEGKIKDHVTETGIRDTSLHSIISSLIQKGRHLRRGTKVPAAEEARIQRVLSQELDDLLGGLSLDDHMNPLFNMPGCDIHKDTPTEILHTVLLGVVKYFWGQTTFLFEKEKNRKMFLTFQARLEAISQRGLNVPKINADYMCKYKGSLIGKHFKMLAQIMPYLVYDLVPQELLDCWSMTGRLVVLLWHTEIINIDKYLDVLTIAIDDLLHATAKCAPSIIIGKPKFHFLVHLPFFIRRFGPAILFSTERYESFNHVFRQSCIFSNRQAPSRDSCAAFALHDTIKHIAMGGFWQQGSNWVQASKAAQIFGSSSEQFGQLYGLVETPAEDAQAGSAHVSLVQQKQADASGNVQADSFIAVHGDRVKPADCVMFYEMNDRNEKQYHIGRVNVIVAEPNVRVAGNTFSVISVTVVVAAFSENLHPLLHVPCYSHTDRCLSIQPQYVLCVINSQHDCYSSQCAHAPTALRASLQEGKEAPRQKTVATHMDVDRYIVNVHSLHNYRYISLVLPASLSKAIHVRRINNCEQVREAAIKTMQDQKKAKKAAEILEAQNALTAAGAGVTVVPAATEKQPRKRAAPKKGAAAKRTAPPSQLQARDIPSNRSAASGSQTSSANPPPPNFPPQLQVGYSAYQQNTMHPPPFQLLDAAALQQLQQATAEQARRMTPYRPGANPQ